MPELLYKVQDVADRLKNHPDQAFVIHHLGRLLDLIEREHAAIMALKPIPFVSPNWERAFSWNARRDVRDANAALNSAREMYYGECGAQWLDDLETVTRRNFSPTDLWRQWDKVREARQRIGRLARGVDTATARERVDAVIAVTYAEALYDLMSRRYRRDFDRPRQFYAENRFRDLRPPRQSRTMRKRGRSRSPAISTYILESTT